MKNVLSFSMVLAISFILFGGVAAAHSFGTNITIPDMVYTGTGWYGNHEDQETEPGTVQSQAWDLEAFFFKGSTLTMVGGFDFQNGKDGYKSGDIFIDTTGDAKYGVAADGTGSGYAIVNNNFGYEYAVRMVFGTTNTVSVFKLNSASTVAVYFGINQESNPLRYSQDGTELNLLNPTFSYATGLSDADVELVGGLHNAVSLDLAGFMTQSELSSFIVHFTMGCGNDNLMGKVQVPEPSTFLLLGFGLIGLTMVGGRRFIK